MIAVAQVEQLTALKLWCANCFCHIFCLLTKVSIIRCHIHTVQEHLYTLLQALRSYSASMIGWHNTKPSGWRNLFPAGLICKYIITTESFRWYRIFPILVYPSPRAMDRFLQQNATILCPCIQDAYTVHIGDLNLDLLFCLPHFYPYTTGD